jgi:trans-aconitate 2-methyltransferase
MNEERTPATDWNAAEYARHSSLQEAMAAEVLALLELGGNEQVLDVGCGDGRLTARIADRVPGGQVLGVDASPDMIAFATGHFGRDGAEPRANLRFAIADARALHFPAEFDLVVSFNALHWVPEQAAALRGIGAALRPRGRAVLRLVVKGALTSLEEVAEATRRAPRWSAHFAGFADPYLRLDAGEYAALAERQGLRVLGQRTGAKSWDFKTHAAFFGFCRAGFGAWTRRLPEAERDAFVADVIDAYRLALAATAAEANLFRFYQMDITLA